MESEARTYTPTQDCEPSFSLLEVTSGPEFKDYFKQLQQVFLYVTDRCNLGCEQCLYKPLLRQGEEFRLDVAVSLLAEFRKNGADKLSVLGGEPTTYKHLPKLIGYSKEIGYKYVRMDTNGQFNPALLDNKDIQRLDEITFSLDGDTPEINDPLRANGAFAKCLENIRKAVSLNLNVNITCCVHRGNVGRDEKGDLLVNRMINFVQKIGVKRINFHLCISFKPNQKEYIWEKLDKGWVLRFHRPADSETITEII